MLNLVVKSWCVWATSGKFCLLYDLNCIHCQETLALLCFLRNFSQDWCVNNWVSSRPAGLLADYYDEGYLQSLNAWRCQVFWCLGTQASVLALPVNPLFLIMVRLNVEQLSFVVWKYILPLEEVSFCSAWCMAAAEITSQPLDVTC